MHPERNGAADRQALLAEAVADYVDAADGGQAPDHRAWLARYPELAEELAEFFAGFDYIDSLAKPLRDSTQSSPGPATPRPEQSTHPPAPPAAVAPPAAG